MRTIRSLFLPILLGSFLHAQSQPASIPGPDPRYKVDILMVIAHPDDDISVASYFAQLIEQQHKHIAVVYATRGNSGGNAVGMEQAAALADVRELEARHSLASYGITDAWFLRGSDTPGGDVLHSLEAWGHGQTLEQVVRLVRLTRPEVIFTWLPDYVVGENHDDHQASSVLANEAFDLADNPLAFPEQLEAPRDRQSISNYGEGLRPWQPKKIYYFTDATHFEFLKGKGPEYGTHGVSPSRKVAYSQIAIEAWKFYQTQNDFTDAQLKEFAEMPVQLIFGKSLVGGTATGDVFEGITPSPIPYARPRGYEPPPSGTTLELGGPWAFYRMFWRAHNIEHLAGLYAPEAQVAQGDSLWVPLLIRNDTGTAQQVILHSALPEGWKQKPETTLITVAAHDSFPVQLSLTPPAKVQKETWETLTWSAESGGTSMGTVKLRVSVAGNGLPQ